MIKVLVVEDSPVAQEFLAHVLTSDPVINVVGFANDGSEALESVEKLRPDVVTMDLHMPKMDGYDATRVIMQRAPTPIVIVSASSGARDVASTFTALEAGALAVVLRPPGIGHPNHAHAARELIRTVKLMSEIKVVKRLAPPRKKVGLAPCVPALKTGESPQLIAIGASTGEPPVLQKILSGLPSDLPVPVLIVQHIAPGFVPGFVDWLANTSHLLLHIAVHGEQPLPGHAYIAPDGFHMGIKKGPKIILSDHAPENHLRPSVAYLFRTVTDVMCPRAVGILLTGMGRDGAEELRLMREKGGLTLAQDEASSIVFGMPGEAIKLGAAVHVLSPAGIIALLSELKKSPNQEPA